MPICRATVKPRSLTALQGLINASCRAICRAICQALMTSTFQLESWTYLHGFNT